MRTNSHLTLVLPPAPKPWSLTLQSLQTLKLLQSLQPLRTLQPLQLLKTLLLQPLQPKSPLFVLLFTRFIARCDDFFVWQVVNLGPIGNRPLSYENASPGATCRVSPEVPIRPEGRLTIGRRLTTCPTQRQVANGAGIVRGRGGAPNRPQVGNLPHKKSGRRTSTGASTYSGSFRPCHSSFMQVSRDNRRSTNAG
jgi:hypothetical protein